MVRVVSRAPGSLFSRSQTFRVDGAVRDRRSPAGNENRDRQSDQRERPGHSRGDRGATARVPPGAGHAERRRHRHVLERGARGGGRRQQRQAAQGPLVPRQLRHPWGGLRRRLPALPDRPRDRGDPGLAGRHRRHRQPRARAGQLLGLPQPRLPRRGAARRRPGAAPGGRRRGRRPALRRPRADRGRAGRGHRRDRHPGGRRPGRRGPHGRRGHQQHPQLRADRAVVPDGVDVRKVDLSIELQILAYHEQRKAAGEACTA